MALYTQIGQTYGLTLAPFIHKGWLLSIPTKLISSLTFINPKAFALP